MPNYAKLAKGLTSAIKGEQKVLPKAEREENLAKFLDRSRVKEKLYHGTTGDFSVFNGAAQSANGKMFGEGYYFTAKPNYASAYATDTTDIPLKPLEGGNVMPVYVSMKNPLVFDGRVASNTTPKQIAEAARANGHDGIIIHGGLGKMQEVIVFNPTQIKSATGNKGTYDVTKPDINEAKGGRIKMGAGGLAKGVKAITSLVKGAQEVLPAAERQANLAKMLEQSVVKDRLYHGTKSPIKSFDLSKRGSSDVSSVGGGIYLTPDPNIASFYSKIVPGESGSNVMPVHAQVKNPFEYDLAMPFKSQKESNEFSRRLQEAGYDSIIKRGKDGEIVELVVFEPSKIKSAIGNKGTYDVTKPDINEAKGGSVKMSAGGAYKAAKAITSLLKGPQDVLPAAEREANLAKFLEQSKTPMRLYHGTTATEAGKGTEAISRLKPSKEGSLGSGVYLTPKPEFAGQYASTAGGNVLPVHAQLRNPLIIEGKHGDPMIEALMKLGMDESKAAKMVERAYENKGYIGKEVENRARAAGYDGLMQYRNGELGEVVSYNPNAVKSAIGNKGTYDVYNQDLNKASGGVINMKGGGKAKAIRGGLEAIKELLSDEPLITAAQRAEAGRKAAELIKAQEQIKASEALGQLMEKGVKRTTTTQADRTRVGGGNIGGAAFPAISAADPNYAGKVWGVMDEGTAARLKNLTESDTAWTTMLGSANQLKTNPIVFDKLKRGFISSMKEGNLSDDLAKKINHNLALTFGEGADIRDPKIWQQANTFEKRAALADVMMGQGIAPGKGGVSLGGEKSGKGVIFKPTEILKRETEPALLHSEHGGDIPTFAAGPRLFKMEKESLYRPDLHPGFPTLIKGEDYGYNVKPTPTEVYLPDWHKRFKEQNPERKGPGYYDLALGVKGEGLPSQKLSDEYIRHLLREGFQDGGTVNDDANKMADGGEISESFAGRLKSALEQHMADGGEVNSFASRLQSALEQHMAEGGEVDNTTPDMTDGGNVNYANGFADGGSAEGAPSATRQMFNNAIAMGKEALEAEYKLLKDPAARADILKRIGLTIAGSGPDLMNLLASGVDLAQEQIPFLRKKVPESIMDEVMPMAYKRPSSYAPKFPLSSNEVPGGAEHQIRNAQEAGLLGEAKAPITETIASLAGPFAVGAAARTAAKTAKAAPRVAKGMVNEMLTPMSPKAAQRGAIGWHGTPHKFPPTEKNPLGEFDPTKIGSGEGAQAYGYGHYTAEAPETAKGYRETLRYKAFDIADEAKKRGFELNAGGRGEFVRQANAERSPEEAAKYLQYANIESRKIPQEKLAELISDYRTLGKGSLYKVDIPDEQVAKMLDWDKPLNKQPEIMAALQKQAEKLASKEARYQAEIEAAKKMPKREMSDDWMKELFGGQSNEEKQLFEKFVQEELSKKDLQSASQEQFNKFLRPDQNWGISGADFYRQIEKDPKAASELFSSIGIPGVKYLDQGSRDAGKGTRNFVVFPGNESMMNIVERHKRGGLAQAKG